MPIMYISKRYYATSASLLYTIARSLYLMNVNHRFIWQFRVILMTAFRSRNANRKKGAKLSAHYTVRGYVASTVRRPFLRE